MLDPVTNFAKVEVSIGYAAGATSIVLAAGAGAKLPQPSTDGAFNLPWWNSTDYADPSDDPDVEIVRVTARAADTLTVTRGQEGTADVNHNTVGKTYKMILALTKVQMDKLVHTVTGYKTGDQATTSATAVDVTDMSFPIAENEVWSVEFKCGATVSAGAGIKIAVNAPAGATVGGGVYGSSNINETFNSTALTGAIMTAPSDPIQIAALIQNGATAGTVRMQFASGDGVVTATIKGGQTYFTARRLA